MRVLILNPPVYDFACFDYWLKPLGLLYIADFLRKNNIEVELFDFMDRHSPYLDRIYREKQFNTGHFRKQNISTPEILADFDRPFFRYGVSNKAFIDFLDKNDFDYVFITSMMTYWYMGIKEVIDTVNHYSSAKTVLGGVYARLMPEHALSLKPDYLFKGDIDTLPDFMHKQLNIKMDAFDYTDLMPAYDLYKNNKSAAILTQIGCPFRCSYCAIGHLSPAFIPFSHDYIISLLNSLEQWGIEDIAFYDDALLYMRNEHFIPLFENIINQHYSMRFHFSNGIHVSYIDEHVVRILSKLNIGRIALSIESVSSDFHTSFDHKTDKESIDRGINMILNTHIDRKNIFIYMMSGIPGQSIDDIINTADYIHSKGLRILMNEFSPVPSTPIYSQYEEQLTDPLLTGKSVFGPYFIYNAEEYQQVKNLIKHYNREL